MVLNLLCTCELPEELLKIPDAQTTAWSNQIKSRWMWNPSFELPRWYQGATNVENHTNGSIILRRLQGFPVMGITSRNVFMVTFLCDCRNWGLSRKVLPKAWSVGHCQFTNSFITGPQEIVQSCETITFLRFIFLVFSFGFFGGLWGSL